MNAIIARALGATFLMGAAVEACTVPVFRFALDRWQADAYRLEVPDGWVNSAGGRAFQKKLDETRTEVEIVSLDGAAAGGNLVMPSDERAVVWSGELGNDASSLFTSPAREEVVRRILAGDSMVWVMIASGEEAADAAFEKRLKSRLAYLGTVAAIPKQDLSDPDSQLGPGPELRVGLSFLRIARDDPREQIFLKMLAGPGKEGESLRRGKEPCAAVVFGRGRVLGVWSSGDLDKQGIDEVSLFLLGACSCRVKVQNPGWDLGLAIDWEARLMAAQMAADRAVEARGGDPAPETPRGPAPAPAALEIRRFGGEKDDPQK